MNKTFLICPGEFSGVGLEVSLKALSSLDNNTDSFIVFTTTDYLNLHKDLSNLELTQIKEPSIHLAPGFYYIDSKLEPVDWFKEACRFCAANSKRAALITGPLVKASFKDPKILGHTEYLRSLYPKQEIFMTFFGEHYNCLLMNDHIPLSLAIKDLSKAKLTKAVATIRQFNPKAQIGLLGLNPHAGEDGLIGSDETLLHRPVAKSLQISGPLSPDGFFSLEDYKKYDFIIANYHDQGLIPFKVLNSFSASQASLGLPFVRTSVNHGTAYNLHLKGSANPASMIQAILLAKKLLKNKSFEG